MTSTANTLIIKRGKDSPNIVWKALGYEGTGAYLPTVDGVVISFVDMSHRPSGYKPALSVNLRSNSDRKRFRRVSCLNVTHEEATVPLDKVRAAFEELRVKEQEAAHARKTRSAEIDAHYAKIDALEQELAVRHHNARIGWGEGSPTLNLEVLGLLPTEATTLMDCLKTFRAPQHTAGYADPTVCRYCDERIEEKK